MIDPNTLTDREIEFLKTLKSQGVTAEQAAARLEAARKVAESKGILTSKEQVEANLPINQPKKGLPGVATGIGKGFLGLAKGALDLVGESGATKAIGKLTGKDTDISEMIPEEAIKGQTGAEKLGKTVFDIGSTIGGAGIGKAAGTLISKVPQVARGAEAVSSAAASLLPKLPQGVAKATSYVASKLPTAGRAAEIAGESIGGAQGLIGSSQGRTITPGEAALGLFADVTLAPLLSYGTSKLFSGANRLINGVPIGQKFTELFEKVVRPSVVGKKAAPDYENYLDKAKTAVETIIQSKPALELTNEFGEIIQDALPSSLKQFADAINQTKEIIFAQYDTLAKQAGEEGLLVDPTGILNELRSIGGSKIKRAFAPEVVRYAETLAERIEAEGPLTPLEAQQAIQFLNQRLMSFYKNPTPEAVTSAYVDALVANRLRQSLDEAVESINLSSASGEGYQALKNRYGALKTVESDVVKRSIVDARKNAVGLLDFADIFSAGDIFRGLATFDPISVGKGAGQIALKEYFKLLNDPNNAVKSLFETADEFLSSSPGEVLSLSKGGPSIELTE